MPPHIELEQSVTTLEARLAALGEALRVHHAEAVASEADALQRALSAAVEHLRRSARAGQLPPQLRQRLAVASGRVAAQRESLARASAALDRAIDVLLLPGLAQPSLYSAAGSARRALGQGGSLLA